MTEATFYQENVYVNEGTIFVVVHANLRLRKEEA